MTEEKKIEIRNESNVDTLLSEAVKNNVSIEMMERLFALREKVKAEQAKEGYMLALSQFQGQLKSVKKNKKVMNKDGATVRYQYATLDSIVEQVQKPLSEAGLSYTWSVINETDFITAKVSITHKLGYSETSEFKVPIDKEGFMTAPQKYASALTFAKRYSLCNALGIMTGDEDTDATDVGKEGEAKSVKAKILFALKTLGENNTDKAKIEEAVKRLTKLELKAENYQEIKARLEVLINEKQGDDSKV
jgi:hypothetical protein